MPSEEAQRKAFELASRPPSGDRKWKRGEMEFEAMMRHLDNAVSKVGLLFEKLAASKCLNCRIFLLIVLFLVAMLF